MSKLSIVKNSVFALLLLGGVAYYVHNFVLAEGRVRELCSQIKPGMALSDLRAFGLKHGLGPQPDRKSVV